MPKVSAIFQSAYLQASKLAGQTKIVKLGHWREDTAYGEEFYVVELPDEDADLRLTGVLSHDIAKLLGDEMDDWENGVVELYAEPITIRDKKTGEEKEVQRLRARAAPGHKALPKKPTPAMGDEIPF
jgi:hypothetical protein